jgi:methionyl-tRNA synthetase
MSKSLKNVVDPFEISSVFGADALRFFLFRETPFGQDGDFSEEAIKSRYENDLAKDFGNLVLRVAKFAESNFPSGVRKLGLPSFGDFSPQELISLWKRAIENIDLFSALSYFSSLVAFSNKFIDSQAPWSKLKMGKVEDAEKIIYSLSYLIKIITFMIYPFCPETALKISRSFGFHSLLDESNPKTIQDIVNYDEVFRVKSTGVLFPKIGG